MPNLTVRGVTREELLYVYRLRHSVYVEELGVPAKTACPVTKTLRDKLDDPAAIVIGAFRDDGLVATIRGNIADRSDAWSYFDLYGVTDDVRRQPSRHALVSAFFSDATARGGLAAYRVLSLLADRLRTEGVSVVYFDCRPAVEDLYRRGGRTVIRSGLVHPTYGFPISVFRWDLRAEPLVARRRQAPVELPLAA